MLLNSMRGTHSMKISIRTFNLLELLPLMIFKWFSYQTVSKSLWDGTCAPTKIVRALFLQQRPGRSAQVSEEWGESDSGGFLNIILGADITLTFPLYSQWGGNKKKGDHKHPGSLFMLRFPCRVVRTGLLFNPSLRRGCTVLNPAKSSSPGVLLF